MTDALSDYETVNTKTVEDRRTLQFTSMEDILEDAEAMDGRELRVVGNWSAAQIVQHVDKFIGASLDGFGFRGSLPVRVFGRLVRGMVLRRPMKPGFKLPALMASFRPGDDVTWEQALSVLRKDMARIRSGERMTHPSPVFGALSHDEWVQLHCHHAALHFGFIHPS